MYTYSLLNDVLDFRNFIDDYFRNTAVKSRWAEHPYIQMYEGDEEVEIQVLIPGVKAGDINLELADNNLVIEAKKDNDQVDKAYLRKEREFGQFKKAVKLPYKVDEKTIKAELKEGILFIRMAKAEEAKPKRIEIN